MKLTMLTIVLSAACASGARATVSAPSSAGVFASVASSADVSFQAQNRKGSKRIGGTGRSGKGGRYVGGRRR